LTQPENIIRSRCTGEITTDMDTEYMDHSAADYR
jgi:hypothetical protein